MLGKVTQRLLSAALVSMSISVLPAFSLAASAEVNESSNTEIVSVHKTNVKDNSGQEKQTGIAPTINDIVKVLDTPEIIAEMEKARNLAGDDKSLLITQRLQSRDLDENGVPTVAPPVNIAEGSEVPAEPTKIFDNLYYVGGTNSGSFIFTTTEGYIMIDAGYNYSPENLLIPGMKKLGLDPAKIKYLLITHAGPDHVGGAKYFQENYGTHIVMSQQEWNVASTKKDSNNANSWPKQDIIGTDGQKLTLGDTTITIVETPRQVNGGGLSYIAQVFDNGEPHMWATYGNTNVVGTLEDKKVYRDSVAHFLSYTDEAKVDVVISDHPFADGSLEKMEELQNRKPGEPNPFVLGQERSRRFFEMLDQCAVVLTGRQEAGLDETGTKRVELNNSSASAEFNKSSNKEIVSADKTNVKDISGQAKQTQTNQSQAQAPVTTSTVNNSTIVLPAEKAPTDHDVSQIEPTKVFDNLYYVGSKNVGAWVVNTSEGIILIDAMNNSEDAENIIVPGMKKLGFDPANIKYVLVTHGHGDHYGGAKYIQDNFGATVLMSSIDWDFMTKNYKDSIAVKAEAEASGKDTSRLRIFTATPTSYTNITDDEKLTLGDTTITVVYTPGHTPGCVSLIIPVTDNGTKHTVSIWGGTGLPQSLEDNKKYENSVDYFNKFTDEAEVDAEISAHPFVDNAAERMNTLRNRKDGEPNPFVIGQDAYKAYMAKMKEYASNNIIKLTK